jgi:hypothetical protein
MFFVVGAFDNTTREEVELFCVDHNVIVECRCKQDMFVIDFSSATNTPSPVGTNAADGKISGLEAIFQILHILLTDIKIEDSSFQRGKQLMRDNYEMMLKRLELQCEDAVCASLFANTSTNSNSLTEGAFRYTLPSREDIDRISLEDVTAAMKQVLVPTHGADISVSGDASLQDIMNLTQYYLGCVPHDSAGSTERSPGLRRTVERQQASTEMSAKAHGRGDSMAKDLRIQIEDNEERAMGYLAGYAPNLWGRLPDGRNLSSYLEVSHSHANEHRRHPLFGHVLMKVFQEVRKLQNG